MISKEEAEEKLLKIFYDVKLDCYHKKNPTHANIDIFEETKDPDHLDQLYRIKDGVLVICMQANSYEHGISYSAVHMAHKSAIHWREDPLSKLLKLYYLFNFALLVIFINLAIFLKYFSLLEAVLINIVGTGVLIYFIVLKINWKKRVLSRFRELFENTGIFLPEEKIKLYSKSLFLDILQLNIFQGSTIFFILVSWVSIIFTKGA